MHVLVSTGEPPSLTNETEIRVQSVKARYAVVAMAVKRVYASRCAICEAGAIGPHGQTEVEGAHFYPKGLNVSEVRTGICLCRRHWRALDVGWWALSDEYSMVVREGQPEGSDYDFIREWRDLSVQLLPCSELRPHLTFIQAPRKIMGFE